MGYIFATAINCMDGRVQRPVIDFITKNYGIDYVDMITEAGPDGILSKDIETGALDSIKKRVAISVNKHGSKLIFIAGHHDCAGNPVDKKTHKENILKAIQIIDKWGFAAQVHGLWIDNNWGVSLLK